MNAQKNALDTALQICLDLNAKYYEEAAQYLWASNQEIAEGRKHLMLILQDGLEDAKTGGDVYLINEAIEYLLDVCFNYVPPQILKEARKQGKAEANSEALGQEILDHQIRG